MIARERDCEPVPHDLVHVVQALKARVGTCLAREMMPKAREGCNRPPPPP